jgi:hypothetical protein
MKREFNCKFCQGKHEAPPGNQGFCLNIGISKLIKANADMINELASVKALREKLANIKRKCGKFKLSLDNGVDQVREHCILLRNQVHLRTDKVIEEVHNFNESLIAEINKYEQECVEAFEKNMKEKSNDLESFVGELNEFHTDKSNYLNEFKIKEHVVEEAVAKADGHLKRLMLENGKFKTMLFNGKTIEFKNSPNNISSALLGSFVFKNVSVGSEKSFKDYNFSNLIFKNHKACLHLFMNEYGTHFGFYINTDNHLNLVRFNNDGQNTLQIFNALESSSVPCSLISAVKVTESRNNFIFHVRFMYASGSRYIRGNGIGVVNNCPCLVFMLDKNFTYCKHTFNNVTNENLSHIVANNSSILLVGLHCEYQHLNMNLDPIIRNSWKTVKTQIGKTVMDVQMNDQHAFFLCNSNKVKIIEISSGELVHEIETSADQMKLASTDYLLLFDSVDRITHVHEQAGEFRKLNQILGKSNKFVAYVSITRDKSNAFALFDLMCMRYMTLN